MAHTPARSRTAPHHARRAAVITEVISRRDIVNHGKRAVDHPRRRRHPANMPMLRLCHHHITGPVGQRLALRCPPPLPHDGMRAAAHAATVLVHAVPTMADHSSLTSVRVLDLAERITTLIEAQVWTRTTLPSQQVVQRRLGAGRETIVATFNLLVERDVIRLYYDPEVSRLPRFLPAQGADEFEVTSSVDRIASIIEDRITSGIWSAENFPNTQDMSRTLRCRTSTVSAALTKLKAHGLVRMVKVKRLTRWVPAGHPDWDQTPLYHKVLYDICSGRWTGTLPPMYKLARHYGTRAVSMGEVRDRLARENVIRYVWLPDFTRRAWYVMDIHAPEWLPPAGGTKATAIAADLIRRLPQWAQAEPDGSLVRRSPLPRPTKLAQYYKCEYKQIKEALNILVHGGLLERDETRPLVEYLPRRLPPCRTLCPNIPRAPQQRL